MKWYSRLWACALLTLVASPMALGAPGIPGGGNPTGFLSLSGEQARAFILPTDMQLENTEALDQHGLGRERYQQYLGNAKVYGGQLTLYRDATGAVTLVMGSYYPNLTPSNSPTLAPGDVRKTVEGEIGADGHWNVDLLINPETGVTSIVLKTNALTAESFIGSTLKMGMY
jgi:Fungalysin/Thermolysin Propeptide Motif